ncbi:MAG TPA: hypothetical protein VGB83_02540 [Actinomycetota bacterium]
MRAVKSLLAIGVVALGLSSAGAPAHPCDSAIAVFSYVQGGGPGVNPNAPSCSAQGDADTEFNQDGRVIYPGHDTIAVRYTGAVKRNPDKVVGYLDGLGFDHRRFSLARGTDQVSGMPVYDSPMIAIGDGAAASGCLDVTVLYKVTKQKRTKSGAIRTIRVTLLKDRSSWHTADSSC